jgi:hypothetical protein
MNEVSEDAASEPNRSDLLWVLRFAWTKVERSRGDAADVHRSQKRSRRVSADKPMK